MFQPNSIYTKIAYLSIEKWLRTNKVHKEKLINIETELKEKKGCFVTIHTKNGQLRGCIGTIYPNYKNLFEEIVHNAIASATRDSRFRELKIEELDEISLTVEILSQPEKIDSKIMLNPKIFGLIISDNMFRKGILLPDIEGIDTIEEQIKIVKKKAGIFESERDDFEYFRFTTDKYF